MPKPALALALLASVYSYPASADEGAPEAPNGGTTAQAATSTNANVVAQPGGETPPPAGTPISQQAEPPVPSRAAIPEKINIEVPEALPSIPRSYHVHRGFYFGVQAGIGFNSGTYDDNAPSGRDLGADGFNLALDFMIGGSPTPGLAVGGALLSDFLLSADFKRNGLNEVESSAMSRLLGVFVDGFPDPKGPFHVGGALGASHIAAKDVSFENKTLGAYGIGYAAWVGYAPWVSDHFSIGGSIRYMSNFSNITKDESAATHSINLLFSAIYF